MENITKRETMYIQFSTFFSWWHDELMFMYVPLHNLLKMAFNLLKPIKIVHKWWWKLLFAYAKKKEKKEKIYAVVCNAQSKILQKKTRQWIELLLN